MDRTNFDLMDFNPTPSCAEARRISQSHKAASARNANGRRRLIDPATCERDYTPGELEFMAAMHDYKMSSGRMFPTWSEVLEVVCGLGYAKKGRPVPPDMASPPALSCVRLRQLD